MNRQIRITYTNGRVSIYEDGTLEFGSFLFLFDCLLDNPAIDLDNPPDNFNTHVLCTIHKYDIKEIDFSNHRRYEFILKDIDDKNHGYDVKFTEVHDPDKEAAIKKASDIADWFEKSGMFKSSADMPGIKVFEGNMADLMKMGKDLPQPIRDVIDQIKRKHAQQDEAPTPEKKITH